MKKVLIMVLMAFVFVGCATDGIYGVAKGGVELGKTVVKVTNTKVSDNVKDAYEVAKKYDTVRGLVREEMKKKPLHVDTNSTKTE